MRIILDPTMPAADAATSIHLSLFDAIRANEDGVRRDLDPRFLHDFRVAIRRTRSALTQIKEVFPAPAVHHFKQEFAWLGTLSGPTRDLDVFLLKVDDYLKALPRPEGDDLAPLRRLLVRRQRREQKRVAAGLGGGRYRRLLVDWKAFLEGTGSGPWTPEAGAGDSPPPNAARPILVVAGKRVWKVFRRVVRRGEAIDGGSPDEALHDLRIDCKKLRYLMEFFRSLYDPAEIGRLIKALKQLQDNLGDFNDCVVQRERLQRFAQEMRDEGSATTATRMAMARLTAHLDRGRTRERRRFRRHFGRFAARENRVRARTLFT